MRFSEHAANKWSQFGEDGMVEEVFRRIGEGNRFCVEFGAADGVSCSNTKSLRERGWGALLIEADADLFASLDTASNQRVQCVNAVVTPENLDHLVASRQVDFMSIDVDGDDYAIFEAMECTPRVLCVEYNQSIPAHISVRQSALGDGFGASAKALVELAESKGYVLLEVTPGNLLFVRASDVGLFRDYERDLGELFDHSALCYAATDYSGRPVFVGQRPPWGLSTIPYVGDTIGDSVIAATIGVEALCDAFEERYGPGNFVTKNLHLAVEVPGPRHVQLLATQLKNYKLVMLDISNHEPTADFEWIVTAGRDLGFDVRVIPSAMIVFVRQS